MNSANARPTTAGGSPPGTVRTLKREGRRGVYLVRRPDGLDEVVKRWPLTPWEFVKLCLGITQAQRQVRGARRLLAAGVPTARPRRDARITSLGGLSVEIRLEWIEGTPLLDRVRTAEADELRRLGEQMADLLGRLRAAGLFHRDGKLSNFVVTPVGTIVAIDPVGVRRSRSADPERERSIRSLACELNDSERVRAAPFLDAAARGEAAAQG